jgi:hypothetical protein
MAANVQCQRLEIAVISDRRKRRSVRIRSGLSAILSSLKAGDRGNRTLVCAR